MTMEAITEAQPVKCGCCLLEILPSELTYHAGKYVMHAARGCVDRLEAQLESYRSLIVSLENEIARLKEKQ